MMAGGALAVSALALMPPRSTPSVEGRNRLDSDFEELLEAIAEAMDEYDVPGVGAGFAFSGAAPVIGLGVAEKSTGVPADADTGFAIASISKTYAAFAAMRLVEQGRLDLDTPIRQYLPTLRLGSQTATVTVTMRHLLTHTSGIQRDAPDDWTHFGDDPDARARMIDRFGELEQLFTPGRRYEYSNLGLDLAGRTIEVVAGQPYEMVIGELILQPLGLDRTSYVASDAADWKLATGYGGRRGRRAWPAFQVQRAEYADGGLVSTARDQLRYAQFWLGNGTAPSGTQLLTTASMRQMTTPGRRAEDGWIGLGWFGETIDDVHVISHDGSVDGFASSITIVPAYGFALVLLTNSDSGGSLTTDVSTWALEYFLDLERE